MALTYIDGDVVRSPEKYIAHGCNAQGRMGKGIAKQIRDDYPEAYRVYRDEYEAGNLSLGTIVPVPCRHPIHGDKTIINAITQEFYWKQGEPKSRFVDYDAVRACFQNINALAIMTQDDSELADMFSGPLTRLAINKIGSDLAGGDWSIIEQIIEEESKDFETVVYLFIPSAG